MQFNNSFPGPEKAADLNGPEVRSEGSRLRNAAGVGGGLSACYESPRRGTSTGMKGRRTLLWMFGELSQVETCWKRTTFKGLAVTLPSPPLTRDVLWIFYLHLATLQQFLLLL